MSMRHSQINVLMRLSLMALLVILLLMSVSCCCGTGSTVLHIEVENRTDQTLTIYVDDKEPFSVEAGKTTKGGIDTGLLNDYFTVKAQNAEGKIFYSKRYFFYDIEDFYLKITIRPP